MQSRVIPSDVLGRLTSLVLRLHRAGRREWIASARESYADACNAKVAQCLVDIMSFITESFAQLIEVAKVTQIHRLRLGIFILILFIDSVNRVYRVQVELTMAKQQGGAAG